MPKQVKVLFVCVGNCVRSQMAEALARHYHGDWMVVTSAGIHPLGFIDPTAKSVVEERGITMDGQFSKGLHSHNLADSDLIVNMSGIPGVNVFRGHRFEDWMVADPFGEDMDLHRRICDDIEARIKVLAERFRAEEETNQSASAAG